jgi:hypothetical protein
MDPTAVEWSPVVTGGALVRDLATVLMQQLDDPSEGSAAHWDNRPGHERRRRAAPVRRSTTGTRWSGSPAAGSDLLRRSGCKASGDPPSCSRRELRQVFADERLPKKGSVTIVHGGL